MSEKVAVYARVSTDEQAEKGTSIENQLDHMRRYCSDRNLEIFQEYVDAGESGGSLERPSVQRLLADAAEGKFGKVIVYKTDRLARSVPDLVNLAFKVFPEYNIHFASITEPYDTATPNGRMFFTQLASFADFERETIKARSREGKLRKAREGKWVGSITHYAYKKDENQRLVPNPETVPHFRMMVEMILERGNTWQISRKLNAMGVPTANQLNGRKVTKVRNLWNPYVVLEMLKNPIIVGRATYAGIEIPVEPVVTPEEFDLIQKQLRKNRRVFGNAPKNEYLLRGILYCKRCGCRMRGQAKKDKRRNSSRGPYVWRVYKCPSGTYPREDVSCGLRSINVAKIEGFVWELTKELVSDSEKMWEAVKARNLDLATDELCTQDTLEAYDRRVKELNRERSRYLDLYGKSEIITVEELEKKIAEVDRELRGIEKDRREYQESHVDLQEKREILEKATEHLKSISSRLDEFTFEEKAELINLLFSRIELSWDEEKKEYSLDFEAQVPVFQDQGEELRGSDSFVMGEPRGEKSQGKVTESGEKIRLPRCKDDQHRTGRGRG